VGWLTVTVVAAALVVLGEAEAEVPRALALIAVTQSPTLMAARVVFSVWLILVAEV
jgi:hypothetical protein